MSDVADWLIEHRGHANTRRIEGYDPLHKVVLVALHCGKCHAAHLYDWRDVSTPTDIPITATEIEARLGWWYGSEAQTEYWKRFQQDHAA